MRSPIVALDHPGRIEKHKDFLRLFRNRAIYFNAKINGASQALLFIEIFGDGAFTR